MDKKVTGRPVKVHRSVKTRILAEPRVGDPYLPKMRFRIDCNIRKLERKEWLAENPVHFEWVPPKDLTGDLGNMELGHP